MTENRTPAGVPTGGQFSASARTEAGVPLPVSPSGLGTGEMVPVVDLNGGDRFVYTWADGSSDGDQVVTFLAAFEGLAGDVIVSVEEQDDYVNLSGDESVERAPAADPRTDPWARADTDIPAPRLDPWASTKPTDDEYATGEYGVTRQTSAPIKPSETDVSPRRAKAFADMIRDGEIDMNPPYQRESVWTMDQRVNLVRSFLAQTPVPAVIVNRRHTPKWAAHNDGPLKAGQAPYAVIDGKQRLETVRAWFNNEFGVPKSWFPPEDVVDYYETADGPYVNYLGLSVPARRDFAQNAILPVGEASVATIAEEAEMYVRVNAAGTAQTDADMDNARAWADGTAQDRDRHQCGYDYDPSCDGCRTAYGDAGY